VTTEAPSRIALRCMCTYPSVPWQQAAGATDDRQVEHMAFRIAQRSFTPIDIRRVAQACGASGVV
jgi:hypothetical protein